jgi:hypothetical protein
MIPAKYSSPSKGIVMLKISGFKKAAALALCWAAVSCTGPVFIKPAASKSAVHATPAAASMAAGPVRPVVTPAAAPLPAEAPVAASPSVLTSSTSSVAAAPTTASDVAATHLSGSAIYCAIAVLMFVALALVIFVLRGKPADAE